MNDKTEIRRCLAEAKTYLCGDVSDDDVVAAVSLLEEIGRLFDLALPAPAVSEAPSIDGARMSDLLIAWRNSCDPESDEDEPTAYGAVIAHINQHVAAAVAGMEQKMIYWRTRALEAEGKRRGAQAPQAGAGADDEPDGCAATGQLCSYAPHGPRGESQCEYCGKEDQRALAAPPAAELPALSDEQIDEVWNSLGGIDRWLKDFGYQQFAHALFDKMAVREEEEPAVDAFEELTAMLEEESRAAIAKSIARHRSRVAAKQAGKEES